ALNVATAVWRVPLNSRGELAGRPESLVSGYGDIVSPSINAAGTRLTFGTREQGVASIRVLDIPSTATKLVAAFDAKVPVRLVMSGNGQVVAYRAGGKAYLVPISGSPSEQICDSCGPPTDVSFEGKEVLLEAPKEPERLQVAISGQAGQPAIEDA